MIVLTLEEIKVQLRFPDTAADPEQDPYLTDLESAAVDYVQDYIGQELPDPLPMAIKQALLILISDMYENREFNVVGASVSSIHFVHDLLHFKRVGLGI